MGKASKCITTNRGLDAAESFRGKEDPNDTTVLTQPLY